VLSYVGCVVCVVGVCLDVVELCLYVIFDCVLCGDCNIRDVFCVLDDEV